MIVGDYKNNPYIFVLKNDECGRKGTKYLRTIFKVTRWSYLKSIKDPGDMTIDSFNIMYKKTMFKFNQRS